MTATIQTAALIARLQNLARSHEEKGKISHALGVRSAISLVKREASRLPKPLKELLPVEVPTFY